MLFNVVLNFQFKRMRLLSDSSGCEERAIAVGCGSSISEIIDL